MLYVGVRQFFAGFNNGIRRDPRILFRSESERFGNIEIGCLLGRHEIDVTASSRL